MGITTDLIYIVLAALVGGIAARLAHQPLILGYIAAGILVGPHTGGTTVHEIHSIEMLAEIGVALLLFTIGLEFSLKDVRRFGRVIFVGIPIQLLLSWLGGFVVGGYFGMPWREAVWFGAIVSFSSTMVVLKSLSGTDLFRSRAGKLMLAILIGQDLAVIPILLVLPQITSAEFQSGQILSALLKSAVFLLSMYFVGHRVIPRLLTIIVRWGSRELFFVATLAIALGVGFFSYKLGLSFPLGAFVAGVLLSETDFHHQALSDVSRLRDLFSLLFFVSVGMLFDPMFFIDHFAMVCTVALILLAVKAISIGAIVRTFGFGGRTPWTVGLGLAQIGEFAFLIARVGEQSTSISAGTYSLVIAVTVVSMMLTPALLWSAPHLHHRFSLLLPKRDMNPDLTPIAEQRPVVIIGGGAVGEYVARILVELHLPHVLVETDHDLVQRLRKKGYEVILGNGADREILKAAMVPNASLTIVAIPDSKKIASIVSEIRELNATARIIVRVEDAADAQNVARLGISEIVQPKLEASFEMVRQVLAALNLSESEILSILAPLRARGGDLNSRVLSTEAITSLGLAHLLDFSWVEIGDRQPLAGFTLAELKLPERHGVSVAGVVRDKEYIPNPSADFRLRTGDVIGIIGTRGQVSSFRDRDTSAERQADG